MAQQTWKNYGGTHKLEKNNHITTNTLITDHFTLRNAYLGNFVISGSVYVSDNIYISTDVQIKGNTDISHNLTVGGNLLVDGNVLIQGNTYLYDNLFVSKDVIVDGSANIYNELFLGSTKQMYLYGSSTGIGINTRQPSAILDISGSKEEILNVYSSEQVNTNIIARNQNHHGIVVSTNDISSCIQFYNDNDIGSGTVDAKIKYSLGGNLVIDTTGNTIVNSKFVVSNRLSKDHIFGEQAIIYDISAGSYLNDYYQQSSYNTGNALSLISDNNNSNTFLNIANPTKIGLAIGGGSIILPADPNTRAMGTIGLIDSGNYVPVQTIVSGNNIISQRATVGINKYNPITETYVLDINGPVHIDNGEIANVDNIPFQINCTDSSGGFMVSVGNAAYLNTSTHKYTYIINYSNNGGKTWNQYNLIDNTSNLNDIQIRFNAVYVHDSLHAIIGGDNGFMYFTNNGGSQWFSIVGSGTNANITSIIYTNGHVKISYDNYTYATFTLATITDLVSNIINMQTGFPSSNYYYQIVSIQNILIKSMCNLDLYTCYAGENAVSTIVDGSGSIIIQNNGGSQSTTHIVVGHVYNKIKTIYDPNSQLYIIIAVGNGIISSATSNSGTYDSFGSFNDITINPIIFKDVYIYDSLRAVACGNESAFYYSMDGYQTWTTVNPKMLNSSGISYLLTNSLQYFVNIYMNDLNSFIITNVLPDSSSNIFYCYLPNLLNHKNNQLLDVCGNMQLSGYLTVDNDVYIKEQLYVVCDSSLNGNLYVGLDSSMNGNVFIRKKLTVAYDSSLNGNLYVSLDASMGGNVFIRKKLTVAYDSSLNGNLYVGLDASMNGNVFIRKKLTVAYDSSLNGNLMVGLDATVGGNIYNKGNLFTNYIDCYHPNSLNIGTNSQPQNINIGNANSTINITGQNVNITGATIQNTGQLETSLHTILLNDGVTEPDGISAGSGIRIRDNGSDNAAFMLISTDMKGLLLKTTDSPNVLNINTSNIQLADSSIGVGLVTLKKSTQLDSSFIMMAADIDVSNIMLKDWRVSDQYTQTATTNIRIFGNTDICGNLYIHNLTNSTAINTGAVQIRGGAAISGNLFVGGILHMDSPIIVNKLATSINPNMMMDISGNATITRLGLNLSSIDGNATLAIRGNIIQTLGFIQQF